MAKNPYREVDASQPVKQRVEIVPPQPGYATRGVDVSVKVVDQKNGTVGLFDQVKTYYHTLILAITAILAGVTQFSPILDWLPGDAKNTVTVAVVFLGGLLNFLKSNEQWVQKLPSAK